MARERVVPTRTVLEGIRSIEEYTGEMVRVLVGEVTAAGVFVVPQQFTIYEIKGDDFAELMSAGPAWAPDKPAGTYRNEDLWVFIDRERANNA